MRLKSAIFDMDGTLLDSMPMWRSLGPELLRRHGLPVPERERRQFRSIEADGVTDYLRRVCGLALSDEEMLDEMRGCMAEFYGSRVQPKAGVQAFLERLEENGVKMIIATATDRDLVEIALRHTELDRFFYEILTSGEVGSHKARSPAIYEEALRRTGTAKEDAVVFEDARHAVRTAKAANFRVAVVYDAAAEDAQAELQQLADFYIRDYGDWLAANSVE